MADPGFIVKSRINLILGEDIFDEIIGRGLKTGKLLLTQRTKLDWFLSGKMPLCEMRINTVVSNIFTTDFQITN